MSDEAKARYEGIGHTCQEQDHFSEKIKLR